MLTLVMPRRDTQAEVRYWYNSGRWRKLRANQLRKQPYCQCPEHKGKRAKAEVVDHVTPHRGNPRLFFKPSNLQSLTKHCHDSWKQSEERKDLKGCNEHGIPNDPSHPWHDE